MPDPLLALRLEEDGYAWSPQAGNTVKIARGDTASLQGLRARLGKRKWLALHVPEEATLELLLPNVPATKIEARSMLRDATPVAVNALAWSHPRPAEGGGAAVTLVKRAWLDPRVAEIETALGILPKVIVEPSGNVLVYRSPAQRRRIAVTGTVVAVSVAISAIALSVAPKREPASFAASQDTRVAALPSFGGVVQTVSAVLGALPQGENIVAISGGANGDAKVELLVTDPDVPRTNLARTGSLKFRETAQSLDPAGGYRITFEAGVPSQSATQLAPILSAGSRTDAVSQVMGHFRAEGVRRVIQLRVGGDAGAGTAPLRLRIAAVGPQSAVLGFADRIESGLPPARLSDWKLQPDSLGVRLTGTLVVTWRKPT